MYAIVACDEKNVNVVRGLVVEDLANSLGENTTEDMSTVEALVDSLNSEEGCRVYLGFGISPASAKEECIHNVLSWGLPVESIINERLPLTYFVVSLKPGRNPHVGDVCWSDVRFCVSLCATFGGEKTAVNNYELSMCK